MTSVTASSLPVCMLDNEKQLFTAFLKTAKNFVEFGAGGSTVYAASIITGSITSLDSSRDWLNVVAAACAEHPEWVQPQLVFADIGPVKEWGQPRDESCREHWPSYATKMWDLPDTDQADLYLIDGRFRVSCFIETLMRCRADAVLLIHDFAERRQYHVIRKFAREIAVSSSLSAFVRRADFDRKDAMHLLEASRYSTN